MATPPSDCLTLLGLPSEIRDHIWSHVLDKRLVKHEDHSRYIIDTVVLRTNKQIKREAERVLDRDHTFVKIETAWEQAALWARQYGIAIVTTGDDGRTFRRTRLTISITLATHGGPAPIHPIIILAEDLHEFCLQWSYQELRFHTTAYPGMNCQFDVQLKITNLELPDAYIPMAKQRDLLRPFEMVKNLAHVGFEGVHPDVKADICAAMETPVATATECLKESMRLKDLGNEALAKKRYDEGLGFYVQSFNAIHIVIKGRQRDIHADEYFQVTLDEAVDGTKVGYMVYFKHRIRLVANVMQAYIYMEKWEEVKYWGMRSINLMREMGGRAADTPNVNMPGTELWGKVYYRTGLAFEQLGEMSEAREMYRIAKVWIPAYSAVIQAVDRTKLRLG